MVVQGSRRLVVVVQMSATLGLHVWVVPALVVLVVITPLSATLAGGVSTGSGGRNYIVAFPAKRLCPTSSELVCLRHVNYVTCARISVVFAVQSGNHGLGLLGRSEDDESTGRLPFIEHHMGFQDCAEWCCQFLQVFLISANGQSTDEHLHPHTGYIPISKTDVQWVITAQHNAAVEFSDKFLRHVDLTETDEPPHIPGAISIGTQLDHSVVVGRS